jgi:aryl-alcohol dehydrogenase-like predicted oxidoreductase
MKLALGTAQFGSHYGAFNGVGRIASEEVSQILREAIGAGIRTLDTALAYGDSERAIGASGLAGSFAIVTKIPSLRQASDPAMRIQTLLSESRGRLGVATVHGLLLHDPSDLLSPIGPSVWRAMKEARDSGQVSKIGVSVYDDEQAFSIVEHYGIDLVQVPVSIIDQRVVHSGLLRDLKAAGIEIHARSVFLQGFVLAEPESLPPQLRRFRDTLSFFRSWCRKAGYTPIEAALAFVRQLPEVDRLVVGVDGLRHLEQIIGAYLDGPKLPAAWACASKDLDLVDPRRWPKIS